MRLHSLVGGKAEIIGPEATLAEAAREMAERGIDGVAVIEGRELIGILTEHDVVAAVAGGSDPENVVVRDWMSEAPDTFSPSVLVAEAAQWLMQTGYRHLPVVADGDLLGIVGIRDLLWAMSSGDRSEQS